MHKETDDIVNSPYIRRAEYTLYAASGILASNSLDCYDKTIKVSCGEPEKHLFLGLTSCIPMSLLHVSRFQAFWDIHARTRQPIVLIADTDD